MASNKQFRPRYAYISGPMSGLPNHNFPAFLAAENVLAQEGIGTLNPARLQELRPPANSLLGWANYIRRDLSIFMTLEIEAVFLLQGWERSKGATLEALNAVALGLPCIAFDGRNEISGHTIASAMTQAFGLATPVTPTEQLTPSRGRGNFVPWDAVQIPMSLRHELESIAMRHSVPIEVARGRSSTSRPTLRYEMAMACKKAGYSLPCIATIIGAGTHSTVVGILKRGKEFHR